MKKDFTHRFEIVSDGVISKDTIILTNDDAVLTIQSEHVIKCGQDDTIVTQQGERYNLRKAVRALPIMLEFIRELDIHMPKHPYLNNVVVDILHDLGETCMKEKYGIKSKE